MKKSIGQIRTADPASKKVLEKYKTEMEHELESILSYWSEFTPDRKFGGFAGRINHLNQILPEAPKGSVLNSRILWTFSAAYNLLKKETYLTTAQQAFDYFLQHFIDKEFGGVYWTVDAKGNPLDRKKQIYALAFAVYGLSEYYVASRLDEAKETAIDVYKTIVHYSYDKVKGGYIEAFSREWQELQDLRLSGKDANERISMNTHLHLLEAFTNLYHIWPDVELKARIVELIRIFLDHMIDPTTHHLRLFFDDDWNAKSPIISFGHDIEAAWLIPEAAESIGDKSLAEEVKERSVNIALAAAEGLDKDGGLWYEQDGDQLIKQKHWWPQSEAMVGFFHAWQLTGDKKNLDHSIQSWQFVQNHLRDMQYGEWHWGINEDCSIMEGEDKVGIWKCPYHNSRACIEIIYRTTKELTDCT